MSDEKINTYADLMCDACKLKLSTALKEYQEEAANTRSPWKKMKAAKKMQGIWTLLCPKCKSSLKENIPKVGI